MNCEYVFCLYNLKQKCTLEESPGINSLCVCDSCIIVTLEENFFEAIKEQQLREMDDRFRKMEEHSI